MMQLLGIDNVFFEVGDLEKAISFYDQLGFKLKFTIPHISSALFNIGNEEPGTTLGSREKPFLVPFVKLERFLNSSSVKTIPRMQ
jgi:catechol 2,3-dioxygenase-like lactoylglutathione lyase family enzyme